MIKPSFNWNKISAILFGLALLFVIHSCSKDDELPVRPATTQEETTEEETTEEETTEEETTEEENPEEETPNAQTPDNQGQEGPNILLIIADDLGNDVLDLYGLGTQTAITPTLNRLASEGVRFTNFWAYPECTPSRASIITGKHGFRTDVLEVDDPLSTTETSIQRWIEQESQVDYANAVIGKWHLSRNRNHPTNIGIQHFEGFIDGGISDYLNWDLQTPTGGMETIREYATSELTDRAVDWVNAQENPWFLWLAYNAPHSPFHLPPLELHDRSNLSSNRAAINDNPLPYYLSSIEAMDTEIGRLLDAIPQNEMDNTVVIFVGDNGTPGQVVDVFETRRAKGSLYQGGIAVPMIVSGVGVTRQNEIEDALVQSPDLFATIAEIAGTVDPNLADSRSIVPLLTDANAQHHDFIFSIVGSDRNGGCAIRNDEFKLIQFNNGTRELFNLNDDPLEANDLLLRGGLSGDESDNFDKLTSALTALIAGQNVPHF